MSALQSGILWWLSVSLAFCLGWAFHALAARGRTVALRCDLLQQDTERLRQDAKNFRRDTKRLATRDRRAEKASALVAAGSGGNPKYPRCLGAPVEQVNQGPGGHRSPVTQRRMST